MSLIYLLASRWCIRQAGDRAAGAFLSDLSLLQYALIEIALLAIALVAARAKSFQRLISRVELILCRWSSRPRACFFALLLASLLLRVILLVIEPVPRPLYHDEFSYLLGADTLAHGRLTNPTPPVPIAFETIHENITPTYESMYLPGTALILTVGSVLHCPWIAVILTTGLLCGTLYWMVSAWLPRQYALVAGMLGIAITSGMNWWFDNYFCISLTSLGGALVLGSVPRIAKHRAIRATWPLALGLVILSFTRPYEGFCVAFPCVVMLLWRLREAGWRKLGSLSIVPAMVLGIAFSWLLYYNWRGTGSPLIFPYMTNFQRYHITGPFLFSVKHAIPHYDLDMLRRFYIFAEIPQYDFMRFHPWLFLQKKIGVYYSNFVPGFGFFVVGGLIFSFRHRREEEFSTLLLAFAGFLINVLLMAWAPFPQYAAPAFPLLLLLVTCGYVYLRQAQFIHLDGLNVARGFVLAEVMLGLSVFGYRISENRNFPEPQYISKDRAHVAAAILEHPGKQLCFVRYAPSHDGWQEWVFNGASPAEERLVWARSLDAETDRRVIEAFPGREIWLATPDYPDELVRPYSTGQTFPLPDYTPRRVNP